MSLDASWDSRQGSSAGRDNLCPPFTRPLQVVDDDTLDVDAKRQIIEGWNQDASVSNEEVRFALNKLERKYCALT